MAIVLGHCCRAVSGRKLQLSLFHPIGKVRHEVMPPAVDHTPSFGELLSHLGAFTRLLSIALVQCHVNQGFG